MIVFIYVVLLFLVLRFTVTLFNFLSNPKLGHYGKKFNDKVSIIILSKGMGSEELVESISLQDYNNIEVIHSNYIKADEASNNASGKYLLLLDENTLLNKGLINSMVYRMKVFELTMLSIIPNRKFANFNDMVLGPLPEFVLINLLPLRLVRLFNSPIFSVPNTSCMMFDTAIYKENRWLEDLGDLAGFDVRAARQVKEKELRAETLVANKLVYKGNIKHMEDYVGHLLQNLDFSIMGVFVFILLAMLGPLILFFEFDIGFMALPIGLIFLTRIMISFLTSQNPLVNILLHPVQMLSLTYLLIHGVFRKLIARRKYEQE